MANARFFWLDDGLHTCFVRFCMSSHSCTIVSLVGEKESRTNVACDFVSRLKVS